MQERRSCNQEPRKTGISFPGTRVPAFLIRKFFRLAAENRFQRKIRIEMIGSQPVSIEEC